MSRFAPLPTAGGCNRTPSVTRTVFPSESARRHIGDLAKRVAEMTLVGETEVSRDFD